MIDRDTKATAAERARATTSASPAPTGSTAQRLSSLRSGQVRRETLQRCGAVAGDRDARTEAHRITDRLAAGDRVVVSGLEGVELPTASIADTGSLPADARRCPCGPGCPRPQRGPAPVPSGRGRPPALRLSCLGPDRPAGTARSKTAGRTTLPPARDEVAAREGSVGDQLQHGSAGARWQRSRMRRKRDVLVAASPAPSGHGSQLLVGMAMALLEAAASLARTGGGVSWDPLVCLYAAADQAWAAPGDHGQMDWRTARTGAGADFRLAVLVADVAAVHALSDGGHLSGRALAADLRTGAAWLAGGVPWPLRRPQAAAAADPQQRGGPLDPHLPVSAPSQEAGGPATCGFYERWSQLSLLEPTG